LTIATAFHLEGGSGDPPTSQSPVIAAISGHSRVDCNLLKYEVGERNMSDSEAVAKIRHALRPGVEKLIDTYYDPAGRFAGHSFDDGDNNPYMITAHDLLSVTFLDVPIKPLTA
jgi:hypothetical protein